MQSRISGTITWSDIFDDEERGAAYPMVERSDAACPDAGRVVRGPAVPCHRVMLHVRNVCAGRSAIMPIVACGCVAGRFCDRCVECGTSPRGRIVELSPPPSWSWAAT